MLQLPLLISRVEPGRKLEENWFVTTRDFPPTLYSQKQDADEKGYTGRARIIYKFIQKVEISQ